MGEGLSSDSAVARKLGALIALTDDEKACLRDLGRRRVTLGVGQDLFIEGDSIDHSYVVEYGWMMRHKDLPDGRRQILAFCLPGDFVGIYGSVCESADSSVQALGPASAFEFEPQAIVDLFARCPRLGAAIAWTAGRDDAILSEHLVGLGRRSAYERLAHLFLELLRRLQQIELAGERTLELPVTQEVLADALGLSVVHVNRTLRRLREEGMIRLTDQRLFIPDPEKLAQKAGFEAEFLEASGFPEKTEARLGGAS